MSATLLQPRPFFCKSVIAPADFGDSLNTFREKELLAKFRLFDHPDWCGATWPPNVVHTSLWDRVGGYSVEFSPGMYSDPDFSAKLWMAGVRLFKGLSASRVYHFEARSTGRVRKNDGSRQFLSKWGITSASFMRGILHRGEPFDPGCAGKINRIALQKDLLRSRVKQFFYLFKKSALANTLWK
ncbi:MAG: hypothetical protein LIP00_03250 [Parabacteroides sp.]|nr:hypothetical protein [Parabacteroides sp.]